MHVGYDHKHTHTHKALPLRVGRPAGDRFEERDPLEAEVEQVDQTHTEGSEEVKRLTDKVTTWRRQKVPLWWSQNSDINTDTIQHEDNKGISRLICVTVGAWFNSLEKVLNCFIYCTHTCPECREGCEELTEQQLFTQDLLDVFLAFHRKTLPEIRVMKSPITARKAEHVSSTHWEQGSVNLSAVWYVNYRFSMLWSRSVATNIVRSWMYEIDSPHLPWGSASLFSLYFPGQSFGRQLCFLALWCRHPRPLLPHLEHTEVKRLLHHSSPET